MALHHRRRVMKPFQAGDFVLVTDELVDTEGWKNTVNLESQRFLEKVDPKVEPIECGECGRQFLTMAAFNMHIRKYCEDGSVGEYKPESETDDAPLMEHTKKELVELASDMGLEINTKMNKTQLVELIEEAQTNGS